MRKSHTKSRNHTTGEQRRVDEAINIINFPNVVTSDIYIDSDDRTDGSVAESFFTNKNNITTSQISRIGLKFIDFFYSIPNSNSRNRDYKVMVVGSPVEVSFQLPIWNYDTVDELFDALKLVMDFEINAQAGIPFSLTYPQIYNSGAYELTGSVDFKFLPSSGITFGNNLHGISYTQGFVSSIKVIPKLFYTRYIDIGITSLLDAKTLSHKFGESKRFNTNNHLTRLYIPFESVEITDPKPSANPVSERPIISVQRQATNFQRENININYYPYRHRDISDIVIEMTDEFQEPLAYESQTITTTDPITSMISEIPYIKYNLVLSTIG